MGTSLALFFTLQIVVVSVWTQEVKLNNRTEVDSSLFEGSTFSHTAVALSSTTVPKHMSFDECPVLRLETEDYVMENRTAFVKGYNMSFNESSYLLEDGRLLVCLPNWNSESLHLEDGAKKFPDAMTYVTAVGLGISIVCLFLHLVAFVFLKQSRNLQDCNLAALCLSLLVGYSSFLVGNNDTWKLTGVPCVLAAVIIHFFLLSSFLWMNTISYDVLNSLVNVTMRKRPAASGFRTRKFVMNCVYSWGIALLFVTVALTFDKLENLPLEFRPLFDNGSCWFRHRKALLIFFVGPAFLLISMNIIFFGISTFIIVKYHVTSADEHRGTVKRNFFMYIRLLIVMGITWIVGAIANSVNSIAIWYVFVVLNTLQGLFIFLAFTCSRQFRDSLNKKWKSRSHGARTTGGGSVVSLCNEEEDGPKKTEVAVF